MRLQNPISALTPTVDAAVLHVLAGADADFTAPSVHRLVPEEHSLSGVRKTLERLVSQGVVLVLTAGQTRLYRLNRNHLLAGPVLSMVRAKDELFSRIRDVIGGWSIEPVDVRLFGSAARGGMRDDSDIDILVVLPDGLDGDSTDDSISALAENITLWTGNDTRPLVYQADEVGTDPLFTNIATDGIQVAGRPRWLENRLRLGRVA